MPDMEFDWTVDPATGRSNSSEQYLALVGSVSEIIRDFRGRTSGEIGCRIAVNLVFDHGLAPKDADEGWAGARGSTTEAFDELEFEISRMVKDAARDIMDGHYDVARLILSQLAHAKDFVPRAAEPA